jgi:hypothetical protein
VDQESSPGFRTHGAKEELTRDRRDTFVPDEEVTNTMVELADTIDAAYAGLGAEDQAPWSQVKSPWVRQTGRTP